MLVDTINSGSEIYKNPNEAHFISLTWNMVNAGHPEIGWSEDGLTVVVHNAERLAGGTLPYYFKHNQYASWVRALNAYDFKKAGSSSWSHPSFRRANPELLPTIKRKAPPRRPARGSQPAETGMAMVRTPKRPSTPLIEFDEERKRCIPPFPFLPSPPLLYNPPHPWSPLPPCAPPFNLAGVQCDPLGQDGAHPPALHRHMRHVRESAGFGPCSSSSRTSRQKLPR